MKAIYFIGSLFYTFSFIHFWEHSVSINFIEKIKGITLVAPPKPFSVDPMTDIKKLNASWIALIPFAFSSSHSCEVRYNTNGSMWWGEKPEGLIESIRLAKLNHIRVLLKPQVYLHNSWVGDIDFNTEEEWLKWENSYQSYILTMAELAAAQQVEMFCIGTEFNIADIKRESFWRNLVYKVRNIYKGKLVYSTNWDHYEQICFWDALDYVGLNAYFPLSEKATPEKSELMTAWQPIKDKLNAFYKINRRAILFTEYGYLSVDGCAGKTWELEKKVKSLAINELAQANAIEALQDSFTNEPYWAGGFLWKWFPNGEGHEGYIERDYSPQHKLAEQKIKSCFEKY